MRLAHFEMFQPVCPRCKAESATVSPLDLARVDQRVDDMVIEGVLACRNSACLTEYPIIDGVPILIANVRKYISDNFLHIAGRDDLTAATETLLGSSVGPGTDFNTARHQLSTYAWDHYGEFAPAEVRAAEAGCAPGNVLAILGAGLGLLPAAVRAPVLDIGCAAGRTTFELAARGGGLALGIDVGIRLLRAAQRLLRTGSITFPLKSGGLTYQRHEFPVSLPHPERVDFWACDALAPPFADATFQFASALNVFDVINSPRGLLVAMQNVLAPGGHAVLSSPYDWSLPVPVAQWSGGLGDSVSADELPLRVLLTPGRHPQSLDKLALIGEIEHHAWAVRVHRRRVASYDAHVVACARM